MYGIDVGKTSSDRPKPYHLWGRVEMPGVASGGDRVPLRPFRVVSQILVVRWLSHGTCREFEILRTHFQDDSPLLRLNKLTQKYVNGGEFQAQLLLSRREQHKIGLCGGEGGIRTPDRLAPMSDFESGAFNRALPPLRFVLQQLTACFYSIVNSTVQKRCFGRLCCISTLGE